MSGHLVPESINFAREEEKILKYWEEIQAFKTCLEQSKNRPRFTFYDGPPFATGTPHYGHLLAGTIKDIVTRYAHQNGFHVERRFGWDCHGVPIECEIDTKLGITGPDDVMKMGIDKYNDECRAIVGRYSGLWKETVNRIGRWIDFENDYKTMYPWFMESVWYIFSQLYNKGLVYKGVKVMPYSTACTTPLSNFEAGMKDCFKDVQDPSVTVSFPVIGEKDTHLIAWTTTPWTLPSNLALCVNAEMDYVKVQDLASNKNYYMMEARLCHLYKIPKEGKESKQFKVISKMKGKELVGKTYEPMFDYFSYMKERGAFKVLCDGYVKDDSGTGIVHQASYFGEDDYRVTMAAGIITKDSKIICPIDAVGKFTDEVPDYKGLYVKEADKQIIKDLKTRGRIVSAGTITHAYPHCWRSGTPLLYKAVPSWFIRVQQMAGKLLNNNSLIHWVPQNVGEKRFGNWLRDSRDWSVSRSRYWGTPIPLWVSEDMQEVVCISSIEELEKLTGAKVTDLHREFVDQLTIPSRCGKGVLRRIPEVFDCWFESGSMPYAQLHYPFEKKKQFDDGFPADFIAEGIDQTRGWFYTLLVISSALFDKPPFKNVVVNGLVLNEKGHKMSKKLRNYPDPNEILKEYGADALRLYLINSPVVRGEDLKFQKQGVLEVLKSISLPLYNAHRMLILNIGEYQLDSGVAFTAKLTHSTNLMDRWILSFTHSLVAFFTQEMQLYHLYTVVPRLVKFIDILTNWYVKLNRQRIKGIDTRQCDRLDALETLYHVLVLTVTLLAPFMPFLTELIWGNMKEYLDPESGMEATKSVHYLMMPKEDRSLIDCQVEESVQLMQTVIETGRTIRDKNNLGGVKYPLKSMVIVHNDASVLKKVESIKKYILEELNVKQLSVSTNKSEWGVQLKGVPKDMKSFAIKYKKDTQKVFAVIKEMKDKDLEELMSKGSAKINGYDVTKDEISVSYAVGENIKNYAAMAEDSLIVLLNTEKVEALEEEGLVREIRNRIQKLRKQAGLNVRDSVKVYVVVKEDNSQLAKVAKRELQNIATETKQTLVYGINHNDKVVAEETYIVKEANLTVVITGEIVVVAKSANNGQITVRAPQLDSKHNSLILNLKSKSGQSLDFIRLLREALTAFDLWTENHAAIYDDENGTNKLCKLDLQNLSGKTLFLRY